MDISTWSGYLSEIVAEDWYKVRALAEIIRTYLCRRSCMRAEPFGVSDGAAKLREEF